MNNEKFQELVLKALKKIIEYTTKDGNCYPEVYNEIKKVLAPANSEFDFKDTLDTPKENKR